MTTTVGYLLLFTAVGVGFILFNLTLGKLLRPAKMNPEKGQIYECGEPTIGSAWVQFDLRFYVVALLFVIFDVEMAFFFPWAVVFGQAVKLADPRLGVEERVATVNQMTVFNGKPEDRENYQRQLQGKAPDTPAATGKQQQDAQLAINANAAGELAWMAFIDILFFF